MPPSPTGCCAARNRSSRSKLPVMLPLGPDARWLFIGDSITDCGRREDEAGLGHGYVRMLRDWLLAKSPADAPAVLNRGVGGNTIRDLDDRWQADVLDEQPDVLSVKIGINDVWRQLDKKGPGVPLGEFVATYDRLIARTIDALPNVKIVLCEPTVISPPQPAEGNVTLLPYAMSIRELATKHREHVAFHVPLHGVCVEAQSQRPDVVWWPDGVHPTTAGHALIARAWLNEAGLL